MFISAAKRFRAVIALAIAAALTVGGVAAAQGGAPSNGSSSNRPAGGGHHQGPPPLGLPMKGLTYAEIHVEQGNEAKAIRVDQGKVLSTSESSITLSENDGKEVTIPTGKETQVLGRPGSKESVEDLQGKLVLVCGPSGGTAKRIMIEPKRLAKNATGQGEGAKPQHGPFGPQPALRGHGAKGGRR